MKTRAFTLIEMLVVIAIIGTLAGIAYPVYQSLIGKSREAACLNNLRSLGVGLQSYIQENNQRLPILAAGRKSKTEDLPVLETVLMPYFESPAAFQCPADKELYSASGSSYLWNSTQSGKLMSELAFFGIKDKPEKIPLITDKEAWHLGKVNFLYADLSSANKQRFVVGN
ncbi:MAG: type II secretion system protein [Gloeobacteraceae cyanobacterium ES-bin-144]|nr:type II secretion system protein [Verrucomicrobiales bacterium]